MPNPRQQRFLTLHIAWRFLTAKRRAMIMSLAGIVFGVAFFIVTQAQTSGFESFFVRTIIGINGAVRVQDEFQHTITSLVADASTEHAGFEVPLREGRAYVSGVSAPAAIKNAIAGFSEVNGVAEVLRGGASITSGFKREEGRVIGIDIKEYISVSNLAQQIRFGSLDNFQTTPSGLLVGARLATRLSVTIGDYVIVQTTGEPRRLQVSGIFETGVDEYDKYHFFIHMREARLLLGKPDGATYLQVSLKNHENAPRVAEQMELVTNHHVASWQERERSWLEVFRVLRISSAISMSIIILIAGLGMFNTLAIIVMERQREIAILRSMGFTRQDVTLIFLNQGLIVLAGGLVFGCMLAYGLTYTVERLPIRIRGIFTADHFLVEWSVWHYVWGAVVAIIVVTLASWLPARRAAKVEPGTIIRGTSA